MTKALPKVLTREVRDHVCVADGAHVVRMLRGGTMGCGCYDKSPIDVTRETWAWDDEAKAIIAAHVHTLGCQPTSSGSRTEEMTTTYERCFGEPFHVLETDSGAYVASARAKLMAAAPELYRACGAMSRALDEAFEQAPSGFLDVIEQARAALAKARGE